MSFWMTCGKLHTLFNLERSLFTVSNLMISSRFTDSDPSIFYACITTSHHTQHRYPVHTVSQLGHLWVHLLDVGFHLPHRINRRNELTVVFEHQCLNLLVVIFDLTLKLVMVLDEILHRIILQKVTHVFLRLEDLRINIQVLHLYCILCYIFYLKTITKSE